MNVIDHHSETSCAIRQTDPAKAQVLRLSHGSTMVTAQDFKAVLLVEGTARVIGDFGLLTVTAGDLVLVSPGAKCESVTLTPAEVLVAEVHPSFLIDQVRWSQPAEKRDPRTTYREVFQPSPTPLVIRPEPMMFRELVSQFERLAAVPSCSSALGRRIVCAAELIWSVEALIETHRVRARRGFHGVQLTEPLRDDVRTALRLIHEHHGSELKVSDLALAASVSESTLRRAVRAATGFTPRAYLQRVRLLRFTQLVAETVLPLGEVTRLVGWSSPSHARAVFLRAHGISPSRFRAQAREARRSDPTPLA